MRALLIQKDTKPIFHMLVLRSRLRALLIQKDTKRSLAPVKRIVCLRALLIQKDTKLYHIERTEHRV